MFKHLRIAVTGLSLTGCVLLIALWGWSRNLWVWLTFEIGAGQKYHIASCNGKLAACRIPNTDAQGKPWVDQFGDDWFHTGLFGMRTRPWVRPVRPEGLIVFTTLTPTRGSEAHIFPALSTSYWALIMISAIAAAGPWANRLSIRFSLRTLHIATTLVALAVGSIVAVT